MHVCVCVCMCVPAGRTYCSWEREGREAAKHSPQQPPAHLLVISMKFILHTHTHTHTHTYTHTHTHTHEPTVNYNPAHIQDIQVYTYTDTCVLIYAEHKNMIINAWQPTRRHAQNHTHAHTHTHTHTHQAHTLLTIISSWSRKAREERTTQQKEKRDTAKREITEMKKKKDRHWKVRAERVR